MFSKRSRRLARAGLLALAAGASLLGCGSSATLSNMWKDPSYQLGRMSSILVVAMKPDPARRRMWEDGLVAGLAEHGVTGTPSYRLFQSLPDTAAVIEAVRRDHYEGVLVARKLPTETFEKYVEGYTTTEPRSAFNPWSQTYQTYYVEVNQPSYTEQGKIVRHEVHLWTTKEGGRLVWAGTGESIDPGSSEQVLKECRKLVVPALASAGFIAPKSK